MRPAWTLAATLILVGAVLLPATALADTRTVSFQKGDGGAFSETDDAYIYSGSSDTNFGSDTKLFVDASSCIAVGTVCKSLVTFPDLVGNQMGQIPRGATVHSAVLEITVTNAGGTQDVYQVTEAWGETTATWNSFATPGSPGTKTRATSFTPPIGRISVNITSVVQAWAHGGPNHGILIASNSTNGVDYDSSESANPPKLTVTFSSPPPPPACRGPVDVGSSASLGDSIADNIRTVFRNPRGTQNRYVIYTDTKNADLVYQYSADGCTWSPKQIITTASPSNFEIAVDDSGRDFRVFLVVFEGNVVKYRRGILSDASESIAFDPAVTVTSASKVLSRGLAASIVRTESGHLIVAYASDVTTSGGTFRTTHLIGSDHDGASPTWKGDILWNDPSSSPNNRDKDRARYSMAPFGGPFPKRFLFAAAVPDGVDTASYKVLTANPSWDGTAFKRTTPTVLRLGVDPPDSLACVVDATIVAHCLVEDASELFSAKASSAGSDSWQTLILVVEPANESGRSTLSIDRSTNPNVLYAIYDKSATGTGSHTDFFYKTSPAGTISWSAETKVTYEGDVTDLISATGDSLDAIHIAGVTAKDIVFFFELTQP